MDCQAIVSAVLTANEHHERKWRSFYCTREAKYRVYWKPRGCEVFCEEHMLSLKKYLDIERVEELDEQATD